MPTLSSLALPPPRNWQDFEDLCCDLWRERWNDPQAQKNGRGGQPQSGVDVFGRPDDGAHYAGVQCKLKGEGAVLTPRQIQEEVEKAKTFEPPLVEFSIATTAPRDVALQKAAREITIAQLQQGSFPVSVVSWEDIVELLASYPELVAKHYPDFVPPQKSVSQQATSSGQGNTTIQIAGGHTTVLTGGSERTAWHGWAVIAFLVVAALALAWLWIRSQPPARPAVYAIRVQVLDSQDRPVEGAKVRASALSESKQLSDGWWEVEVASAKLPADGRITLSAEHENWKESQVSLHLGQDPNPRAELRLEELKNRPRDQKVGSPGGPLPGVLVTPPEDVPARPEIYSVRVHVLDPAGRPVEGSKVRASVSSESKQLADGGWELDISRAKIPADGKITLSAEHASWGGSRINLRLGQDPNPQAELRLSEPESWLRGQAVDGSGRPLSGVRVSVQGGGPGDATTDEDGRFELKLSEPPETWVRLHAEHQGVTGDTFCYTDRDSCPIVLERK